MEILKRVIPNIILIFLIFKAGDKDSFENYRPISMLPQFSKVLEKLFENRLINFVVKNNVLNDNQYGFR